MDASGIPDVVERYQIAMHADLAVHPIVAQEFHPDTGWTTPRWRKRITPSWAEKLRREGFTAVAVNYGGRCADFTIAELCRRPRRTIRP